MIIMGLEKRSQTEREAAITHLSKKPIKDLWEKQALIKAQQTHVFDQYVKAIKMHNYDEAKKLERKSEELHEKEIDIKEAIKRK